MSHILKEGAYFVKIRSAHDFSFGPSEKRWVISF